MARTSANSTTSNNTAGSTVSNAELKQQTEEALALAKSEKERLESEKQITAEKRQQLQLSTSSATQAESQQKQIQSYIADEKAYTTAISNKDTEIKKLQSTLDNLNSSTTTTTTSTSTTTTSESSESTSDTTEESEDTEEGSYLGKIMGTSLAIGAGGAAFQQLSANVFPGLNAEIGSGVGTLIGGPIGTVVGALVGDALDTVNSAISSAIDTATELIGALADTLESGIDKAVTAATTYQGSISARLYGLQDTTVSIGKQVNAYDQILADIQAAGFFESSYVSTEKLLATIDNYAQAGIVYNIEQRAFLGTIQSELVSTFSEAEGELRRLIRLQQSDLTMIFLGFEATLNEKLTQWFDDTSYLTDKYDSVASQLLDAVSLMSTDETVSFEYAVQKWLGALYSLGATDLITSLAQGINWLASGNVNQLASNQTTQTLLVQAIERAGESYSDWLLNGLDADKIDTLMENIVGLLQDVVTNTEGNNVTRSQYASSVYGISMADLSAVYNMTAEDITNLKSSAMTSTTAMESFNTQMENYVMNRVDMAQRLDTVVDNLLFSFGREIENNGDAYFAWKIAQKLDELGATSDGTSYNLLQTLFGDTTQYTAAAIYAQEFIDFGNDFFGNVVGALSSFMNGSDTDIETFQRGFTDLVNSLYDWKDMLDETRGTGFTTVSESNETVTTGISQSTTTSTTSELQSAIDTTFYTLANQAAAVQAETIASQETTQANDASDIYDELFEIQNTPIKVSVQAIDAAALKDLAESLYASKITDIYNQLVDGTTKVADVNSENIGDIFSTLSAVRGYY